MLKKTDAKRADIIRKLADHLLLEGMRGASLRQMAKAAGTSDRMLLHYFADKDELMAMTLAEVAQRFNRLLDMAKSEPAPFQELVEQLAGMVNHPEVKSYLRLWLELAASAAGGDEAHRAIASKIFDGYFAWVASAIHVEQEEVRAPLAALAVATVEGFVLLDAFGAGAVIARALEGMRKC